MSKSLLSFLLAPFIVACMPFTFIAVCMRISYAFIDRSFYNIFKGN